MDCGCDDEDNGLFGEFNPDTRNKGWAPRFSADAGPDGCGGRCGRAGWPIDPNPAEDFPSVPPVGVHAPSWFGGALPEDPGSDQPAPGEDGDDDGGEFPALVECTSPPARAECEASLPAGQQCFCYMQANDCVCEPAVLVDGTRPLRPDGPVDIGFKQVLPVEPSVPVPIFDTPVGDDSADECKLTDCDDEMAKNLGLVRTGCTYRPAENASKKQNYTQNFYAAWQGIAMGRNGYYAGILEGHHWAIAFRDNGNPVWVITPVEPPDAESTCMRCNDPGPCVG